MSARWLWSWVSGPPLACWVATPVPRRGTTGNPEGLADAATQGQVRSSRGRGARVPPSPVRWRPRGEGREETEGHERWGKSERVKGAEAERAKGGGGGAGRRTQKRRGAKGGAGGLPPGRRPATGPGALGGWERFVGGAEAGRTSGGRLERRGWRGGSIVGGGSRERREEV